MPCYDSRDDAGELHRTVDRLTRIACNAMKHIENGKPLTNETKVWWEQHKEQDRLEAIRKKEANARKTANDLLTLEQLAKRLGKVVI